VAVEEGELLLAVGGIVGRIEVDRNAPRPAPEPPSMMRGPRGLGKSGGLLPKMDDTLMIRVNPA